MVSAPVPTAVAENVAGVLVDVESATSEINALPVVYCPPVGSDSVRTTTAVLPVSASKMLSNAVEKDEVTVILLINLNVAETETIS